MAEQNVYSRLVSYVGGLQGLVSCPFDNKTRLLDSVWYFKSFYFVMQSKSLQPCLVVSDCHDSFSGTSITCQIVAMINVSIWISSAQNLKNGPAFHGVLRFFAHIFLYRIIHYFIDWALGQQLFRQMMMVAAAAQFSMSVEEFSVISLLFDLNSRGRVSLRFTSDILNPNRSLWSCLVPKMWM